MLLSCHTVNLCALQILLSSCSCLSWWLSNFWTFRAEEHIWQIGLETFTCKGGQTASFPVDCSVRQEAQFWAHAASYWRRCRLAGGAFCAFTPVCQWHIVPQQMPTSRHRHTRLSRYADDINSWCKSRHLQLNADKTEAIWVGSHPNLAKISNSYFSIQVQVMMMTD